MKITITDTPAPMFTSFTMCADLYEQVKKLKETKVITVENSFHTKTRIATSIQVGEARNGVNWNMDGFKTFEHSEHNYFSGGMSVSHYFVKSKKQDFEAYKLYVIELVKKVLLNFNVELNEIEIKLINKVW
jgi:hypothetical protein